MKRANRILLGVGCLLLLALSWAVAIQTKSADEKQADLMAQADTYLQDDIYIRAIPLLEEAAGYQTKHTIDAENTLKTVYLALIDQSGYANKYTDLLKKQMSRKDATPDIFAEAAQYYLNTAEVSGALSILRDGLHKTGSEELSALYEQERYAYQLNRASYSEATAIYEGTIQVAMDGRWGLAAANGALLLPCMYDSISTFCQDRAMVQKDGEIYGVDIDNNRVAYLHEPALRIGNFDGSYVPVELADGWRWANQELELGQMTVETAKMFSGGYAAAQSAGKWGVLGVDAQWLVPAEYDGVIQDELGRCYAQGAVFLKKGDAVVLFSGGEPIDGSYEDAWPFADGYAAVKRDGKWGFVDTGGTVVVDFQFDEARSFGQHLAAVRTGDLWGYISRDGRMVIEPTFLQAGQFSGGSAPVFTTDGWQFISLLEYQKGASL